MYCCNFDFICWNDDGRTTEEKQEALERNYGGRLGLESEEPEPVLLNVYGAPELMPRNEFRQPM